MHPSAGAGFLEESGGCPVRGFFRGDLVVVDGVGRTPSLCLSPGGGEIGMGSVSPVGGEIGMGSFSPSGDEIGVGRLLSVVGEIEEG